MFIVWVTMHTYLGFLSILRPTMLICLEFLSIVWPTMLICLGFLCIVWPTMHACPEFLCILRSTMHIYPTLAHGSVDYGSDELDYGRSRTGLIHYRSRFYHCPSNYGSFFPTDSHRAIALPAPICQLQHSKNELQPN